MRTARVRMPGSLLDGLYVQVVESRPGYRQGSQHEVRLLAGRGVYRPGDRVFLADAHLVMQEKGK